MQNIDFFAYMTASHICGIKYFFVVFNTTTTLVTSKRMPLWPSPAGLAGSSQPLCYLATNMGHWEPEWPAFRHPAGHLTLGPNPNGAQRSAVSLQAVADHSAAPRGRFAAILGSLSSE